MQRQLLKTSSRLIRQSGSKSRLSDLCYRHLFETAQEGLLIVDAASGRIVDVNSFLHKLLGYTKTELLGKQLWEIDFFRNIAEAKVAFLELQNKGCVRFKDLFIKTKGGRKIYVECVGNIYPVGTQSFMQYSIRDITDRKNTEQKLTERLRSLEAINNQLNINNQDIENSKKALMNVMEDFEVVNAAMESEKAKNEAVLTSIGDAVFATDNNGKIVLFNQAAVGITGISARNAIGRHYKQIITFVNEDDGLPSRDYITEAIENNKVTKMAVHVVLVRKDGRQIPVADSAAPVKNKQGRIIGCVVVFHDVTKERQVDKAKTEFVSLASHQLRTPLSTINWYTEMLLSLDVGKLTQKQRQYAQEIYHASRRMVNLVNALLNVSRLELGTFTVEPKPVKIAEIVQVSINELKPQIVKKKLIVKLKHDRMFSTVNVDPKLFLIILQNLLSNSVKYTETGGRITLTIKENKGNLLITVADSGIGIPANQQGQIFDKLSRADNAKKIDPDGSGLGLYIVKEIIAYAGGKVWFKSTQGKGSTFFVSLPLSGMHQKIGSKSLI